MGSYLDDLKNFLLINLWHSFDLCDFDSKIEKIEKIGSHDEFFKNLLKVLRKFHNNLSCLRYGLDYLKENNNKINEIINTKHDKVINEVNNLLHNFPIFKQTISNEYCPEALENSFIEGYYKIIKDTLTLLIDEVKIKKKSLNEIEDELKKQNESEETNFLLKFYNKFIANHITDNEKNNWEKSFEYLLKKQKRYLGEDRLGYWERQKCFKKKDFKDEIKKIIIETPPSEGNHIPEATCLVRFICFILSKYHIILHKYYTYDYKFISQYFGANREKQEEEIKRAQKIFTFTRLITKYFNSIFEHTDRTQNDKKISECLVLLSYLRRGFAYLLLDNPEKAFNDFSKVEKYANLLRKNSLQNTDNVTTLYSRLMLPYTYSLKGELYRRNFSFYNAHQYFCNSITKLEDLKNSKNDKIEKILNNSIALIRIKINKGKTFLELGEFKKSLKWFLKALLDYLKITKNSINNSKDPENNTRKANNTKNIENITEDIDKAIRYLEETKLDTHISKKELYNKIEPIVSDLQKIQNNFYPLLFSDICTRIAVVLTLLKLPDYSNNNKMTSKNPKRHGLALKWLEQAYYCLGSASYQIISSKLSKISKLSEISSQLSQISSKLPQIAKLPEIAELSEISSQLSQIAKLPEIAELSEISSQLSQISSKLPQISVLDKISSKLSKISKLSEISSQLSQISSKLPEIAELSEISSQLSQISSKLLQIAELPDKGKPKIYCNALTILNCLILYEKLKLIKDDDLPCLCTEAIELLKNGKYELIHFGGFRDIIYRILAITTLKSLQSKKNDKQDWEKDIAQRLLQSLLIYTEDFSIKNAELYRYLMKERKITRTKDERSIYIYGLQRWSSINPALVRPSAFKIKGGGMLIVYNGKGIAIDPGINFIENLYSEGFSIADIDYIIATHDHIDHIADVDTLMSLYYRRYKIEGSSKVKKNPLTLILNPSVSARYSFLINQNPELFRKIELSTEDDWRKIFEDFQIKAITVEHFDLSAPKYSNTIGLILSFGKKFKIGITSDTFYKEEIIQKFIDEHLDIFIVHINSVPFRELKAACDVSIDEKICKFLDLMKKNKKFEPILKEILYSLGYNYDDYDKKVLMEEERWNQLFNDEEPILGQHLLLYGTLKTFERFIETTSYSKNKLFLITEISEEMGNYRSKVARYLNDHFEKKNRSNSVKCLTMDIGMCIRIKDISNPKIEIRCSECRLSNDHDEDDRFHPISEIKEVCLKQEEEGLFYFCPYHDPEGPYKSTEEYEFAERLERYQPFRHIDIRIT